MMDEKKSITSLKLEELAEELKRMGQPGYRAKQVFGWLHKKNVCGFEEMTDLPAALRGALAEAFYVDAPRLDQVQTSSDGTQKLLLALADGNKIETVVMQYHHGVSVCLSSQVGCRMGCGFCATTHGPKPPLVRNLTAGEILAQVYAAGRASQSRVDSVVLMGIGEPLDNYDEVLRFISLVTSKEGYGLSGRGISLSTCGVVPGIYRLAKEKLGITLSVSVHAPTNAARSAMMPVNKTWPLEEVMEACRVYREATGRRVSVEYAMVRGTNDSYEDARLLAQWLKGSDTHVNLIATNPVDGSPYSAADQARIEEFIGWLRAYGVNATQRRRLGTDIDAACGQLRNKHTDTV